MFSVNIPVKISYPFGDRILDCRLNNCSNEIFNSVLDGKKTWCATVYDIVSQINLKVYFKCSDFINARTISFIIFPNTRYIVEGLNECDSCEPDGEKVDTPIEVNADVKPKAESSDIKDIEQYFIEKAIKENKVITVTSQGRDKSGTVVKYDEPKRLLLLKNGAEEICVYLNRASWISIE